MGLINVKETDLQKLLNSKKKKQEVEQDEYETVVDSQSFAPIASETAYDKLLGDLDTIEKKYSIEAPKAEKLNETISLDRKEYIEKSDDDLRKEAEAALLEYAQTKKNAINGEAEVASKELATKLPELEKQSETDKQKIDVAYERAKESTANDALKRGLARSSIVIHQLAAFDEGKLRELNEIDRNLTSSINKINDQLSTLNLQKTKALNDFDLVYVAKLNEKIADLKTDLQKKQSEVIEYNNKVAETEANYEKSAKAQNDKLEQDLYEQFLKTLDAKTKYGTDIENEIFKQKTSTIQSYLDSLSRSDAIAALENDPMFRTVLGPAYSMVAFNTRNRKD